MKKWFLNFVILCCIGIILSFVFMVFFSYAHYSGSGKIIRPFNFQIFMVLTLGTAFIYTKYIAKLKTFRAIGASFIPVIVYFLIIFLLESNLHYIISDYYEKTPYESLVYISEYAKTKGNYITVREKLISEGFSVDYIVEGYTDRFDVSIKEEVISYSKRVYYVNYDFFIIYDWNNNEIVASITEDSLQDLFIDKINITNYERIWYTGSTMRARLNDGHVLIYKLVPNKDNDFDFVKINY
ncbi:MAG: hypothetical protein MJB12_15960 [Firmicutes bacterium]|nr:hypothetical protein [Bacillota bacterium]